ncbi:Transcription factor TFIIIB component B [Cadophora gregata]|uniref:Transcription factor TFIIIB component B n=1 Tax=Cadophora gregata TaxID=51156 RepID=UPI0026DD0EA3|nr:Transcription factor TFIIIB component B [Cadophora gregata]KAK0124644.1 Transcription factor TFIIIB component B [Cadophora gregata]KAK0129498.1 Transcription factor TFIIIB component B [Cadophora gregata f. sp. sojae]
MLKGRGKVFAPKKVVRKPQGSAPPSSRPSVERSSQTPAPQPSQESVTTVPEKANVPESTVESDVPHAEPNRRQIPSQEDQEQAVASVTQDGGSTARPDLKRKERGDVIAPPPPKRVSTASERPNVPAATIEAPIIDISNQENTPQPEPSPAQVASTAQPPSISTPASQTQPISKPAARPRIIPPKQKQKAVDVTASQAPTKSPESRRQHGPSAVSQPVQSTSLEPASTPSETSASASVPTPPAAIPGANEQPPETLIPEAPIRTTEEEHPASPSPERSPEPPRHRYPSPQNIVRLADEGPAESSNMGRAGGGGIGIGSGDISLRPGEVNQASEIVPIGALNPDGTSGAIQVDEPASATESSAEKGKDKPKRKYTKRKKVQPPGDGEDARTTLGMHLNRPRRVAGKRKDKKKDGTRGRKERAATPEGASDEEIDQSTLTMTDLCRDLRIGKKFSRHKEIKDRVEANKKLNIKKKMIMNNPEIDGLVGDGPPDGAAIASGSGSGAPAPTPSEDREPTPEVAAGAGGGPQIRLVNGELVVDEASLQIDRQARARANAIDMEEVIEDDFTRVITSGTYMKREKSMLWDHAATIRFYEGLAQFGTDFEMIAKLFPHRNRRQIKLKFNKEERAHPDRVTKAMVGPKKRAIDLNTFERLADEKLEDVAAIEAEYEEYENQMLAKEKEEMDAAAEITRQKKAAIQGAAAARKILATMDSDEEREGEGEVRVDSAKENGHQRRRGQKKKNRHSHYAGGEKVTVLETIDY